MSNPVVETIQSAYQQFGYATLRFNFRGVGGSQGQFDNGVGEKDDVCAAVAYAQRMNVAWIDLAGYSFGAWVNAAVAAAERTAVHSMLMVAPPVGFISFKNIDALKCLRLVVTGSCDDIAPADQIRNLLPTWNPHAEFKIIDGCDHFYSGHLQALKSILIRNLQSAESGAP
jgi:alpha/beta superfamily hydrolase